MIRRIGSLLVSTVVAASVLLTAAPSVAEAAPACGTTTQSSYSVTVCITAPAPGSSVSGNPQTSATVSFTGASPGVQRMVFNLDGAYLLTDYSSPYTFALPSAQWIDGAHTLSASALLRDGVASSPVTMPLTFSNGVTLPPVPPSDFVPRSTTAARPVVAAAGDGPDGGTASDQVASLISGWNPDLALYLGDVYEKGSVAEFHNWYGATGWGTLAPITNPAVGNHEYEGGVANGYFNYWHQPPHYYSFTAGSWKVISLDSTSQFGQTAKSSDQYKWLQTELSSSPPCVMVYFHHPVYSIGPQGNTASMQDIWQLLVTSGVDLVLTGHDHSYQRWVPLDKNGNAAANGVTQFVVGTAGHGIQAFTRTDTRVAAGFDTSPAAYGALKMTLNPSGVGYLFADTNGTARDGGAIQCSGTSQDTQAPTAVNGLTGNAPVGSRVELAWPASVDNVGISEYRIYRNGTLLSTTHDTVYRDFAVVPGSTYQYSVTAMDAAGNASSPGTVVTVRTPADGGLLFTDDFETGTFAKWTTAGAMSVDAAAAYSGSFGAREVTSGTPAFAKANLSTSRTDLYYRVRFKIVSTDASNQYLLRLRTATDGSLMGVYVNSSGKLYYRNDVAGASVSSSQVVSLGAWHELQVHLKVAGAQGLIETWYDGAPVAALTRQEDFGSTGVGKLQIGDNASGRTHQTTFDDVIASLSYIVDTTPPQPDTAPPSAPGAVIASATAPDRVTLSWGAAIDNVGVSAYDIYRSESSDADEGLVLYATVPASPTNLVDVVAPETTYQYQVRARDEAGNVGPPSASALVTTPPLPSSGTFTFSPTADSYVDDSLPSSNYGTATTLRIDASPQQISYLRFDLNGIGGAVSQVTLRLYARANGSKGCSVLPVSNTSWGETTLTWANAPSRGASLGSCATFSANTWVDVNLPTSLVTGNGPLSLAVTNPSSTSTRFDSREGANPPQLVVVTAAPDTQKPSAPTNLQGSATGSTSISLSWQASTDNVGVVAYDIFRGGTVAATVIGSTLSYSDSGLQPQTTYLYRVVARDAAGNVSDPSNDAIVVTDPAPASGTFTFDVAADSYVDSSTPAANYGTATTLRIDASPQQISYLRFDLSGVVGTVSSVTLRLYAQAKGTKGCNVLPVADTSWTEGGLTWNNAPARGASVASCGNFAANTWVTINLPASLVSGNGSLSLAITNPSSTSTRFSSREGPNAAQLVVVTVPASP